MWFSTELDANSSSTLVDDLNVCLVGSIVKLV